LLARRVTGKLDEEESSILAHAVESIQRLSALMQDLLALNDAGIAPQQPKLIPVTEPLEIALANLAHHFAESGATVTTSELPTLMADRTQLAMVFQNLIGNAIKYRREEKSGSKLFVKDRLRVSPSPTMAKASSRSTHPAYLSPSNVFTVSKCPGSGIGHATCKRTIERFGGTIWADSIPGKGSNPQRPSYFRRFVI
jgi:light-regulated signal transduction histidine kinase (bacteriophytochrome)